MPRRAKADTTPAAPAAPAAWTPRRLRWVGDGSAYVPGYRQADLEPRHEDEAAALLATGLWAEPEPDAEPDAEPESEPDAAEPNPPTEMPAG